MANQIPIDTDTLGGQLRQARMNANLSIKDLAEQVGITPNYLSTIERNARKPSDELLEKLKTTTQNQQSNNKSSDNLPADNQQDAALQAAELLIEHPEAGGAFILSTYQKLPSEKQKELLCSAINIMKH